MLVHLFQITDKEMFHLRNHVRRNPYVEKLRLAEKLSIVKILLTAVQ